MSFLIKRSHKITEPSAQIPTMIEIAAILKAAGARHKITEPSAQIPTFSPIKEGKIYFDLEDGSGHKITEPSAQIPTPYCKQDPRILACHKITEPSAQIPTQELAAMQALCLDFKVSLENKGHKITEPSAQIPTRW